MMDYMDQLNNSLGNQGFSSEPEPLGINKYTLSEQELDGIDKVAQSMANLAQEAPVMDKYKRLSVAAENKRQALRKDNIDYGDDSTFIEGAKSFANNFLPHEYQLAVNRDGKRYTTENKIFNDEDLSNAWNNIQENPNGDKVLYYLKKLDGYNEDGSPKWLYKPGIAHVSAADRYKAQLADSEWQLIGEKRFDEASTLEKKIHGNEEFLKHRAFDYGTSTTDPDKATKEGLAYNDFGAGKSELYTKDILGIDTGSEEEYRANQEKSKAVMMDALMTPGQRNDTFEFIDAFQASAVTLAGKLIKGVGEVISDAEGDGALESIGKKLQKDANKIAGYNPKTMMNGAAQMKAGFREGNPLDIVMGALKAGPQAVAGSILETGLVAGAIASGGPAGGAAILGLIAANTNDTLDEREKANNGRKATLEEATGVFLGESLATLIDYASFKFVTVGKSLGLKIPNETKVFNFDKALETMKPNSIVEFTKALGKMTTKASTAYGAEAIQEGATELIRTLGSKYGTVEYQGESVLDILKDPKVFSEINTAMVLGGAGGVTMNAPKTLKEGVSDIAKIAKESNQYKDTEYASEGITDEADRAIKLDATELGIEESRNMYESFKGTAKILDRIANMDPTKAHVAINKLKNDPRSQGMFSNIEVNNKSNKEEVDNALNIMTGSLNANLNILESKVKQQGYRQQTIKEQELPNQGNFKDLVGRAKELDGTNKKDVTGFLDSLEDLTDDRLKQLTDPTSQMSKKLEKTLQIGTNTFKVDITRVNQTAQDILNQRQVSNELLIGSTNNDLTASIDVLSNQADPSSKDIKKLFTAVAASNKELTQEDVNKLNTLSDTFLKTNDVTPAMQRIQSKFKKIFKSKLTMTPTEAETTTYKAPVQVDTTNDNPEVINVHTVDTNGKVSVKEVTDPTLVKEKDVVDIVNTIDGISPNVLPIIQNTMSQLIANKKDKPEVKYDLKSYIEDVVRKVPDNASTREVKEAVINTINNPNMRKLVLYATDPSTNSILNSDDTDVIITEDIDKIIEDNSKREYRDKKLKKDKLYKPTVTLENLTKFFTGDTSMLNLSSDLSKVNNLTSNIFNTKAKEFIDKISNIKLPSSRVFNSENQTDSDTKAKLLSFIGMDQVLSSMKAKLDIDSNLGFPAEHNAVAPKEEIIYQIGKAYLDTFGKNVYGNPESVAALQASIGQDAIDMLVDAKVIEEVTIKMPSNYNQVDEYGETSMRNKSTLDNVTKESYKGFETVGYKFTNIDTNTHKSKQLEEAMDQYKELLPLVNALNPENQELPFNQEKVVPKYNNKGVPLPKEQQEAIQAAQEDPLYIKGSFKKILDQMHEDYINYVNSDSKPNKYSFFTGSGKKWGNLINTLSTNDFSQAMQDTVVGKTKGRVNAMINFLDNYEELINEPLYFSYDVANNNRAHVFETVLDFQGDNQIARAILTDNDPNSIKVIRTKEELHRLLDYVVDESGFTLAQVVGTDTTNTELEEALNLSFEELIDPTMDDGPIVSGEKSKFHTLAYLEVIKDIRQAINNNTPLDIETQFVPGVDASSSGLVITMSSMYGIDPKLDKFIEESGLLEGNKFDGYKILIDAINSKIDKYKETIKKAPSKSAKLASMLEELNLIKSFLIKERDLSKDPTMTYVYSSTPKAIARRLGEFITQELDNRLVNKNDPDYSKVQTLISNTLGSTTDTLTNEDFNKLSKHFTETIGNFYGKTLEETFKPLTDVRNKYLEKPYILLDNIRRDNANTYSDIKFANPFETSKDPEQRRKTGLSLLKEKQVDIGMLDSDNNVRMFKQSQEGNVASGNVLPQHITDSWLMFKSLKEAKDKAEDLGMGVKGVMTVHDALYGDTDFLNLFTEIYNKNAIEAAYNIDIIGNMLDEMKYVQQTYASNLTPDFQSQLTEQIQSLESAINRAKLKKDSVFKQDGFKLNILGSMNSVTSEEVDAIIDGSFNTDPTKKKKPVVKAKPKPKKKLSTKYPEVSKLFNASGLEIDTLLKFGKVTQDHLNLLTKFLVDHKDNIEEVVKEVSTVGEMQYLDNKVYLALKNTMDTRTGNTTAMEDLIELAAHEVTHFYEADYVQFRLADGDTAESLVQGKTEESKVILANIAKYRLDFLNDLLNRVTDEPIADVLTKLDERKMYALYGTSDITKVLPGNSFDKAATKENINKARKQIKEVNVRSFVEFTTIMRNEPKYAKEIMGIKDSMYTRLIEAVRKLFNKLIAEYPNNKPVKMAKLFGSNYHNKVKFLHALDVFNHNASLMQGKGKVDMSTPFGAVDTNSSLDRAYNNIMSPIFMLNNILSKGIINGLIPTVKAGINWSFHKVGEKVTDKRLGTILSETANTLTTGNSRNSFVRKMSGYINTNELLSGNKSFTNILDQFTELSKTKQSLDNNILHTMKIKVNKALGSDKERSIINTFIAKIDMGNFINHDNTTYMNIISGKTSLATAIKDYESKVSNPINIKRAKETGKFYTTGVLTSNAYPNINSLSGVRSLTDLRTLSTLYAMRELGTDISVLTNMHSKHPSTLRELEGIISTIDTQNSIIRKNHGDIASNNTMDVYDTRYTKRLVTMNEWKTKSWVGWKVLKKPTATSYGVLYKENASEYIEGLGTSLDRINNDILIYDLDPDISSLTDNIETTIVNGKTVHKYVLTNKMKETLGVINNPADSLIRTYAHNRELLDSESIRRQMLDNEVLTIKDSRDEAKLVKMIQDKHLDIPWFIKLDKDMSINDLDPVIVKYYTKARALTSYNDFGSNISLVRSDMSDFVLGYKKGRVFTDGVPGKLDTIYRRLIQMLKQHLVLANPVKIAWDTASNMSLLMSKGVAPYKLITMAKGVTEELREIHKLKQELVNLDVMKITSPTRSKAIDAKKAKIEARLESLPLYYPYRRGLSQSIADSIITKNTDSVSGLQNDVNKVISAIFRKENKELNAAGELIMKFAKKGPGVEQVFAGISAVAKSRNQTIEEVATSVADTIKDIKKEDDIEAYLSQYLATPGSLMIQAGAGTTLAVDEWSKGVLYYHNTKVLGMSKEAATKDIVNTFIDYRINKPEEVENVEQYGPIMFYAFVGKVQRVMFNVFTGKPVNATTAIILSELLNDSDDTLSNATIFGSNIISKLDNDQVLNIQEIQGTMFAPYL